MIERPTTGKLLLNYNHKEYLGCQLDLDINTFNHLLVHTRVYTPPKANLLHSGL
ncbi:hypothetical protein RintRC_3650 [Richelia intracellularis]|nr:hypothetical protein RintRC_3650 [Richelia intracellularis]